MSGEFEVVIMIEVAIEEMHGSDRMSEPEIDYERALGWLRTIIYESEMALFLECMQSCAQKVVDTADIVRDAIFRQLSECGRCPRKEAALTQFF